MQGCLLGLESTTLAGRCLFASSLLLLLLESNRTRQVPQIPRQTWRASCTDSQRSDPQLWDMYGGKTRARRFFLERKVVRARRGGWTDFHGSGRSEESGRCDVDGFLFDETGIMTIVVSTKGPMCYAYLLGEPTVRAPKTASAASLIAFCTSFAFGPAGFRPVSINGVPRSDASLMCGTSGNSPNTRSSSSLAMVWKASVEPNR